MEWVPSDNIPSSTSENVLEVTVPAGTGQFSTISAAVASITDASVLNPYLIIVYPGVYVESNITIPSDVAIRGVNEYSVFILPQSTSQSVFIMEDRTALSNMAFRDTINVTVPLIVATAAPSINLQDVQFEDVNIGVQLGPSPTSPVSAFINNLRGIGAINTLLIVDGSGANAVSMFATTTSWKTTLTTNATTIIVHGSLANAVIQNVECIGTLGMTNSTAMSVYDGAICSVNNIGVEHMNYGISDAAGTGADIEIGAINLVDVGIAVHIINADSTGQLTGYVVPNLLDIVRESTFTPRDRILFEVTVGEKGADFTSVTDALAYIASRTGTLAVSSSALYVIVVGPGTYVEAPFTLPQYVSLIGDNPLSTIIQASDLTTSFITTNTDSTIRQCSFIGPSDPGTCCIVYDGAASSSLFLEDLVVSQAGDALIKLTTDVGNVCSVSISRVEFRTPFVTGIDARNTSGFVVGFLVNELNAVNDLGSPVDTTIIRLDGTSFPLGNNSMQCVIRDSIVNDPLATDTVTALEVVGAASVTVSGLYVTQNKTAISILNSATSPVLRIAGSVFDNLTSTSVDIQNANTNGFVNIVADTSAIVNTSTVLKFVVQGSVGGSLTVTGDLNLGTELSTATNVSALINEGALGVLMGGVLSAGAGFDVDVTAGTGYLVTALDDLQYTPWAAQTDTLTASDTFYVYIDSSAVIQHDVTVPDRAQNIVLGIVRTTGSAVDFILDTAQRSDHLASTFEQQYRESIGVVFIAGCIVTEGGTADTLDVTDGTYTYGARNFTPTGGTGVTFIIYTSTVRDQSASVLPSPSSVFQYDVSGTVTPIPSGKFAKHLLLVANDGSLEVYVLVYGQTAFDSQVLAEAGDLPTIPSFLGGSFAPIAGIVVDDDLGVVSTVDARPFPSFQSVASGGGGTTDHQSLTNRASSTAHTQYLLRDGSDTMTGTLQMNTNSITGATTVNGVVVETHASRHLPGGADALTTQVVVSVGSSNTEGVAAAFARADHQHNHGDLAGGSLHADATGSVAGFMSAADKTTLDARTSTPTASVLVTYTAASILESEGLVVRASGTAPGSQSTLVLYDATSSDTNAATIQSPDTLTSAYTWLLPIQQGGSGQLLQNDGSGNLSWLTPSFSTFVVQLRTTSSQTVNTSLSVPVTLTWDITDELDASAFTLPSSSTIRIEQVGRYDIFVNFVGTMFTGNNSAEADVIIQVTLNGTPLASSARGMFDRVVDFSSTCFRTIQTLAINDVLSVTGLGGSGTLSSVQPVSGESLWMITSV
jgi:hypothetical protein